MRACSYCRTIATERLSHCQFYQGVEIELATKYNRVNLVIRRSSQIDPASSAPIKPPKKRPHNTLVACATLFALESCIVVARRELDGTPVPDTPAVQPLA
jgi:hypothetical protein